MRVDGENVIDKVEAECMKLHKETQYVNDQGMNRIEIKWTTFFRGAERYPTMPVYVQDFKVGVINSVATFHLVSSSVHENTTHSNTSFSVTRECSPLINNSADNPSVAIPVDCLFSEDTGYPFQNGDVLLVTTSITNGGYLDTVGYPNVNQTDRTYYEGLIFNTSASFTFDFEEPYHCFLNTSCDPSSLLERGPPYTKESTIDISWSGWLDDISQVHHYEIHVLPTQSNNGLLTCSEDRSVAEKWDGFAPASNCSVNVSDPGECT
ncbi:uncharacterized protein [Ptychodera flava]|uniref:uncharacterized protein n=1 Tax=Ptychodera flava TaxID=63121 RepID=UPI00396A9F0E